MREILSLGLFGFMLSSLSVADARDSVDPTAKLEPGSQLVKVWLRDGSFFRGEPIEVVPKDHITLQLHDGKTMRIDWLKITNVDGLPSATPVKDAKQSFPSRKRDVDDDDEELFGGRAKQKKVPERQPSAAAASSAAPPPPPSVAPAKTSMPLTVGATPKVIRFTGVTGGVAVEYLTHSLEVEGSYWLGQSGGTYAEAWQPLCSPPCQATVDPARPLRITGPNIVQSKRLYVPVRSDRYEAEIKTGSRALRASAWATLGVGMAVATIGNIILTIAVQSPEIDTKDRRLLITGLTGTGVGILSMLGSIAQFKASATTVEYYRE